MSVLRPGCGENGTVYVHAAVFYVLANLMAGRPERALEVLGRIAPMMEAHDPEVTQGAPYAYVNSYVGPCYPAHEGRTLTNWFTSSSSWTLLTVTDWLLGVRPTYEGLLIDPCLPEEWEHAILRRAWRGAEYEVEIRKPKGLTKGETSVTVDGERQAGALVPSHGDGKKHRVAVEISAG
jgi:cellobiose phosphorylase